jgi:hypothetical protein
MDILFSLLATDLGQWLAGLVAAGLVALGLYRKGRADQRATSQTADLKTANDILTGAADARADAGRRDSDPDRLRDDDGFRRPDK